MSNEQYTVISLGGSLMVPKLTEEGGINVPFLKEFRELILDELKTGRRFIIVAGGGRTTRAYQRAAVEILDTSDEELDWIGIYSTRLNARLLVTLFEDEVHDMILDHEPTETELQDLREADKHIYIASGWVPGRSTDHSGVKLAEKFGCSDFIIAGDIDHVYDKDPRKSDDAKPFSQMTWGEYQKLIPVDWIPGLSSPVDPTAAKVAESSGITAKILIGSDIANLKAAIDGEQFEGTVIR